MKFQSTYWFDLKPASWEGTCIWQFLGNQEPDIRQSRAYGKAKYYWFKNKHINKKNEL